MGRRSGAPRAADSAGGDAARRLRALLAVLLLQLLCGLVWWLFLGVGAHAHPNYRVLMGGAWLAGAIITALWPGWRWFFLAGAIVALPRFAGIVFNGPAHSVLFPWLAGLALGPALSIVGGMWRRTPGALALVRAVVRLPAAAAARGEQAAMLIFGLFLLLGLGRSFLQAYSPLVLVGLPVMDRQVAPGVSANYAFYLSLLLGINLLGPLVFYLSDRLYSGALWTRPRLAPENQILAGLGLATGLHILSHLLESLGFLRLAAGAGDHWQQAGRLPGLLTDSGASTLLTPLLVGTAALGLYALTAGYLRRRASWSRSARFALAGAVVVLALAILFPLSYWHGRAYFLNLAGVGLLWATLGWSAHRRRAPDRDHRRAGDARQRWRSALIISIGASAGGILLALFAIFVSASDAPAALALRSASERMAPFFARGEIYEALYQLDPHRARYLMYGLRLLLDSPWIGHGFNSFQVELMRFAPGEAPDLLIDNPANLALGLLSDSGVLGGACFLGPFVLTLRRFWRVRGTGTVVPAWLAGLTIALWPAMMIGYHLVFAEFAALLFLPLYAGRSDERERGAPIVPSVPDDAFPAASEPGIRRRAWHYAYFVIMGAASLLYAVIAAWQLATARVDPAAWRAPERGGRMRPAPAETRKNCAYDFSECYRTRLNRPGQPGKSLFG